MEKGELKNNLKNTNMWSRVFYMFLFIIFYGVAEAVFYIFVMFQIFHGVITGKANLRIQSFGSDLSLYMYHVLQYLIMNSDEKPFPFTDWQTEKNKISR